MVWLKDKEATHCKLCEKEFSLSKRKVREVGSESKSFSANMASNFIHIYIYIFFFPDFSNSTTVETVGKFSVMLALTMNCLCLLHQSQYGFVIPATRCWFRDAHLTCRKMPQLKSLLYESTYDECYIWTYTHLKHFLSSFQPVFVSFIFHIFMGSRSCIIWYFLSIQSFQQGML